MVRFAPQAKAAGNLSRQLRVLTHPALLVVDESATCRSTNGAVLFFQIINARHERASTVLTSNKDCCQLSRTGVACSATR